MRWRGVSEARRAAELIASSACDLLPYLLFVPLPLFCLFFLSLPLSIFFPLNIAVLFFKFCYYSCSKELKGASLLFASRRRPFKTKEKLRSD